MIQPRLTRILYVNHTGLVSGGERVLLTMLQVLDGTRYEPHVLCPGDAELSRMVAALDVPCIVLPPLQARITWRPGRLLRYAASLWRGILATRQAVLKLEPDLIHANSLRAGVVATIATIGTDRKVIWHVHDILPKHPVSTAIRLLAYMSKRTYLLAVSHSAARAFCRRLPFKNRVQTVYNGIDLNRFPLKAPGGSTFRREVGIAEDAFLVCAVGQICARKGLIELVNAFSKVCGQAPGMHLAIVGRVVFAHEEDNCRLLVRTVASAGLTDRVHFTGERSDVASVLQASDLLVLNSVEEPFGLVLVESMSSGTPVLATRVGGIPEIVRDSENGWLVEKGDIAALASKLLELSQNVDMLRHARNVTSPQFSLERFQGNLSRFYTELAQPDSSWSRRSITEIASYERPQGD